MHCGEHIRHWQAGSLALAPLEKSNLKGKKIQRAVQQKLTQHLKQLYSKNIS